MRKTLITAHSGCLNSPANTIESVVLGLQKGADFSEVDVRLTLDNKLLLCHDGELKTRNYGNIPINETSYNRLQELEQSGEILFKHERAKLTLLSEVLDCLKETEGKLNLDIKDDLCIPSLAKSVRLKKMSHRVVITGCDNIRAAYFKSHFPDFQVFLNIDTKNLNDKGQDKREEIEKICKNAIMSSCCGLNLNDNYCHPLLVEMARKHFLAVSVWTVNDSERMKELIELGVDSMTTLEPSKLKNLLP